MLEVDFDWADAEACRMILATAVAEATTHGVAVTVALVDDTGRTCAMQVMRGTFLTSDKVAAAKAFTAWNFRESTRVLAERIPDTTKSDLMSRDDRLSFLIGGVPAKDKRGLVGAIGVSGASAAVDEEIALAALATLVRES